ncbi:MAG: DUF1552 domain-containing protein [Polyangiales bacterium]
MSFPLQKRPLSRRHFLRGAAGITIALPMLDIFGAENVEAQNAPGFMVFMREGNGVAQEGGGQPEMFWPTALGALSAATMNGRVVDELSAYADKLLMVRGVNSWMGTDGGCGHAAGGAHLLTAQNSDAGGRLQLAFGESVDNRVARELNAPGREPLTLAAAGEVLTNAYIPAVLSYRGYRDRRGAETNPWTAYQKVLGMSSVDTGNTAAVNEIATRRKSANDFVREQMNALLGRTDLSSLDRDRLDLHFSSIRDMEIQMTTAQCLPITAARANEIQARNADPTNGDTVVQVAEMQIDIIAFALSCGYTQAATLQVGTGNDYTRYFVNGVRQPPFHGISHGIFSDIDTTPVENFQWLHSQIDRIHARLFKRLIDKVSEYGILNKGVLAWVNDLGNGWTHSASNLPIILAGNANGYLKTGQYVDAGDVTINKLHNTLLNAVGIRKAGGAKVDDFGDAGLAKGEIAQMIA